MHGLPRQADLPGGADLDHPADLVSDCGGRVGGSGGPLRADDRHASAGEPDGFAAETTALIVDRTRLGIVLGVVFFAATVPLDAVLGPSVGASLLVRGFASGALLSLLAIRRRRAEIGAPPFALVLAVEVVLVSSLGALALLAPSAADPYYALQQSGVVILILGSGALLPVPAGSVAAAVSIPMALEIVLGLWFPVRPNLPFLFAASASAVIAVIAGESAWRVRRREYEARMRAARSEDAVRESEERFRSAFEQAAVGMALTDPEGRFVRVNRRFGEMHGYAREELLRMRFQELVHPDDLPANLESLRRFRAGEIQEFSTESRGVRKDGSVLPILVTVAPVRGAGHRPESFIAVVSDLTEKRRTEDLRRDLVAMLSHDVKNPLGVVIGLAEILRDEPPDGPEERRELLDTIEIAARRALGLAVNFVDAMRIESGSFELHREDVSVNEIVERVVAQEQAVARRQKIAIETDLSREVPPLRLDEQGMERVVANLLGNALKFSSAGNRVRIATVRKGSEVVLSVSDQGPGIPPELRERLFDRYSPAAAAARKGGSGLGLFVVKTVAEAHGGAVRVACPPEGGSVFEVRLPAGTVRARADAAGATQAATTGT